MKNRAVSIAMDIARRAERALGGRMGYAEGGEVSNRNMSKAISNATARGKPLTPEQEQYLKDMQAFREGNSERLAGALPSATKELVRALSPPIPGWSAKGFDDWSAENQQKQAERRGMPEGERFKSVLGEAAMEGLPYALPEIGGMIGQGIRAFPKTSRATIGGMGMMAGTADATGESPEQIKERQKILTQAGLYNGPIDGDNGPATRKAQEAYDRSAAARDAREVEKIKAQAALAAAQAQGRETERKATEGEITEAKRKKGEERFQEAEKNLDPFNRIVRDWGPTAGYVAGAGLGMLSKWGVNKASNAMSKSAATRADELLSKEAPDLAARAANVNQFWSEGQRVPFRGSRTAPFEANPGNIPAFKSNADAVPSTDLYLPSRAKNLGVDAGVAGAFGAESLYAQEAMAPEAKQELATARAAFAQDPSESNLARLQTALNKTAMADALTNLGRAGGLSYLASGIKMHRNPTRPDISRAEAERTRIDELLAGKPAPGASPAIPALPPPLPPGGPQGLAGAQILPGLPPIPAPTPIPSPPAGTASLGTGPLAGAVEGASSSPATVFVPVRVSPTGRMNYAKGVPEDLGVRPGGWVKSEHRPPKEEVPRKRAGSKTDKKADVSAKGQSQKPESIQADDIPIKPDKLPDDPSLLTRGMNRGGVVGRAMHIARNTGGRVHVGPTTHRADGGRTDTIPVDLPASSYVVPSDVVSSLGEGDTNAGYNVLANMFGSHETEARDGARPAIIAGGEYVLSPEQVAQIGGGNVELGFQALDQWIKLQRRKTIQTLKSLPPPAKD